MKEQAVHEMSTTEQSDDIKWASVAWNREKCEAFGKELDAILADVRAKIGQEDVSYIKKIRKISQIAQVAGRSLIHFSFDPLTFSAGVFSLFIHKQLEATEIGHSALHGAWDGLKGGEDFQSKDFYWKTPVSEDAWKKEHNILHHQYTNIVGRDPDLNYGSLRVTEKTTWMSYHLIQAAQFFWTAPVFLWVIGLYATGLTDIMSDEKDDTYARILPDRKPKTVLKAVYKTARKMVPYSLKEFAFWPMLAGPFWWKVFAGNLISEVMRDVYSIATIYAGHFGDDLEYFDKDYKPQGRGEWYKMQIEAAHNYAVPSFISKLCGALDYQIEHHLFPKLPPNRLREIQPKVQAVCEKFGLKYNKKDWGTNLKAALKRITKMSSVDGTLRTYLKDLPQLVS